MAVRHDDDLVAAPVVHEQRPAPRLDDDRVDHVACAVEQDLEPAAVVCDLHFAHQPVYFELQGDWPHRSASRRAAAPHPRPAAASTVATPCAGAFAVDV